MIPLTLGVAGLTVAASANQGPPVVPGTKSVLFVGNDRDGTADVIDPQSFAKLGRFSAVLDLEERLRETYADRSGWAPSSLVTRTVRVPLTARQRRGRTRMVHLPFAGSDRLYSEPPASAPGAARPTSPAPPRRSTARAG